MLLKCLLSLLSLHPNYGKVQGPWWQLLAPLPHSFLPDLPIYLPTPFLPSPLLSIPFYFPTLFLPSPFLSIPFYFPTPFLPDSFPLLPLSFTAPFLPSPFPSLPLSFATTFFYYPFPFEPLFCPSFLKKNVGPTVGQTSYRIHFTSDKISYSYILLCTRYSILMHAPLPFTKFRKISENFCTKRAQNLISTNNICFIPKVIVYKWVYMWDRKKFDCDSCIKE